MNISSDYLNWFLYQSCAGEYDTPSNLKADLNWIKAIVPGTAAQTLLESDSWSIDDNLNFDDFDWWYKTTFDITKSKLQESSFIQFKGLATVADIWLNGHLICKTDNMFKLYCIDVAEYIKEKNELFIRFQALNKLIANHKARPAWKTKVVKQQQLRWFRTTLLGRIPGWTPPVAPVGPWQEIIFTSGNLVENVKLNTSVNNSLAKLDFTANLSSSATLANIAIEIDGQSYPVNQTKKNHKLRLSTTIQLRDMKLWWPHTHGDTNLYPLKLLLNFENGSTESHSLGKVGFKEIEVDQSDDNFNVLVNGINVFCRGACWTVNDIVSLVGDKKQLYQNLKLMRDAGANMIRIGGTMLYEQDLFYEICDELGVMVWQDFMFANMDYPFHDNTFKANVESEIEYQLSRLCKHPCVAIYCGSSEIEQQVAMLGLPQTDWEIPFYQESLPELIKESGTTASYISSSPSGGSLPFRANQNLSHYYGVGAYLCSPSELRKHDVKFTSECLGFSNIPIEKHRNSVLNGDSISTTDPRWKKRTPRDIGTGWDFEDIRDHYLEQLFKVDASSLRYFDTEQYLKLSEVTTGEIMSQVFDEWRSNHSNCSGGLVWFMKDLWLGAGWGIIDSLGIPKACYYYLKRKWTSVNISLTDESVNGIDAHISNELLKDVNVTLIITALNNDDVTILNTTKTLIIPSNSTITLNVEKIVKQFHDLTYTYKFGPPKIKVLKASLYRDGEVVSESHYFPIKEIVPNVSDITLTHELVEFSDTEVIFRINSNKFLYAVTIESPGYQPNDNFFHLVPNSDKYITLQKNKSISRFKCIVTALNMTDILRIKIPN